jgi:ferrochelatase
MSDFDSFLLVSFGGPEGPDEVLPFLRNVVRGRNIPEERLVEVGEHYHLFGGVSPINQQNRDLLAELSLAFSESGLELPLYWGNRNWAPYIPDALREMKEAGRKKTLVFFTALFSCYSGCRQYRENLEVASEEIGEGVPELHKLRMAYNHPGFVAAMSDRLNDALWSLPEELQDDAVVLFSAHSIPLSMAEGSEYVEQLQESSRLVAEKSGVVDYRIVYQSRSGAPHIPWLEPDVCDVICELSDSGVGAVVVVPIGFVSDHMEVIYDLDVEAKAVAEEREMAFARAGTAGTHPAFVKMTVELVQERVSGAEKKCVGRHGPSHDLCPKGCCHYDPPARPART